MEIARPEDDAKHHWLAWLGLQEPPPTAESWMPVARAFRIDAPDNTSSMAGELVKTLQGEGIDAQQRSYALTPRGQYWPSGTADRGLTVSVAVGVHNRDRARATEIATRFLKEHTPAPKSDAELDRTIVDSDEFRRSVSN